MLSGAPRVSDRCPRRAFPARVGPRPGRPAVRAGHYQLPSLPKAPFRRRRKTKPPAGEAPTPPGQGCRPRRAAAPQGLPLPPSSRTPYGQGHRQSIAMIIMRVRHIGAKGRAFFHQHLGLGIEVRGFPRRLYLPYQLQRFPGLGEATRARRARPMRPRSCGPLCRRENQIQLRVSSLRPECRYLARFGLGACPGFILHPKFAGPFFKPLFPKYLRFL